MDAMQRPHRLQAGKVCQKSAIGAEIGGVKKKGWRRGVNLGLTSGTNEGLRGGSKGKWGVDWVP